VTPTTPRLSTTTRLSTTPRLLRDMQNGSGDSLGRRSVEIEVPSKVSSGKGVAVAPSPRWYQGLDQEEIPKGMIDGSNRRAHLKRAGQALENKIKDMESTWDKNYDKFYHIRGAEGGKTALKVVAWVLTVMTAFIPMGLLWGYSVMTDHFQELQTQRNLEYLSTPPKRENLGAPQSSY